MGGIGSVLRTTIVGDEFKRQHNPSQITFLTNKEGIQILKYCPSVDRILSDDPINLLTLLSEKFDFIYNFEVNPVTLSLTHLIESPIKFGFEMNHNGLPKIASPVSTDLYRFQIDDKFREENKKPIQQLLLESVGMKWKNQPIHLLLDKNDSEYAMNYLKKLKIQRYKIIGLNLGSKKKHARKRWPIDYFIKLAEELNKIPGVKPFLLGGPEETEIYNHAVQKLRKFNIPGNQCNNTLGQFMALLNNCEVVVSATTFALFAAIALKIKTVAICSPKPYCEIENYEMGLKITSPGKYNPLYSTKIENLTLDDELKIGLKNISVKDVLEATYDLLHDSFMNPVRFSS
ncbi:MAG: glycosyltransferase family 9 protein [Patescibacteria group bacterium]|nr:glycosyltransferase family 9 protein [Patescibacteria group bacterium]MCL5095351.1 glycosyltransferase family 9 protein [Patescibacteria group bacterium]